MSDTVDQAADWKQLHLYAVVRRSLSAASGVLLPFLFIFVLTSPEDFSLLRVVTGAGILLAVTLCYCLYNLVWWKRFAYRANSDGIEMQWGILIRRSRFAARSRIQRVTGQNGPLMRLLSLTELHIETAGGSSEPELRLPSVPVVEAQRLQALFADESADCGYSGETRERAYRLRIIDMIIAGITSGGALAILFFFMGAYSELSPLIPESLRDWFVGLFPSPPWAALAVLGGLLIASWLVASLLYLESFWNFTAVREGEHISISRGYFTRRSTELEVGRIHSITVLETPLRSLFGRAVLKVSVVGQSTSSGMDSAKLIPLIPGSELGSTLRAILPEYPVPERLQPPSTSALWLYLLRGLLGSLPVALPAGAAVWFWQLHGSVVWAAVLPVLIAALGTVWGWLCFRDAGFGFAGSAAAVRTRLWSRRTVIMHRHRVQAVELRRSPLERIAGCETLWLAAVTGGMQFRSLMGGTVRSYTQTQLEPLLRWSGSTNLVDR